VIMGFCRVLHSLWRTLQNPMITAEGGGSR